MTNDPDGVLGLLFPRVAKESVGVICTGRGRTFCVTRSSLRAPVETIREWISVAEAIGPGNDSFRFRRKHLFRTRQGRHLRFRRF